MLCQLNAVVENQGCGGPSGGCGDEPGPSPDTAYLPPSWEFMTFRANSMALQKVVASSLLAKFKP